MGTGLTVTLAASQPTPGLFGESFASRSFTALNFTASSDGDITVSDLTVERTGQANDAVFNGVVLLDDQMQRVGDAKTFGSNHQLKLTDDFVVKAGQTRTMTLAGDSDADQNDYNGQIASLSLVAVNAGSATVNGTFPMTGTAHTVNSTLSIGSLTLTRGALDPGAGVTKEIGTVGYTFAGLKLTAGSNEDVIVKSIKFNQSSSAASADLANIVVNVAGTDYPATVSTDGKYYTAIFGTGTTIGKGNNVELYVKGDVVSGSNRGVDFDLYRYADLKATGAIYGYDILPTATDGGGSATDDDGSLQAANPNYDAFESTIGSGSLSVAKDASVGATTVTTNLGDQVLGGFTVDVKGEQVSVAAINFDASWTEAAGTGGAVDTNDFTSVTLVDSTSGNVVAGPVDGVAGGNNAVRFTDTVTFPIGVTKYLLKAKLSTDFSQSDQVAASTTPASDWTTVKGVTSGTTITPSGGTVTLSTMTVKTGALAVSMHPDTASSTPDGNVVAGTNAVTFSKIVLSASNSGEDLRVNSMKIDLTTAQPGNANDDLTNCQIYDGSTALNTGTNAVNPTNAQTQGADYLFTFDVGLVIPKTTTKTLELKCNLVAGGTATRLGFGLSNLTTAADQVVVSGVTSGTSIAETVTADNGLTVVVRSGGTLAVTLDSSSPSLALVQAGKTGNTLSVLRFNSLYEDVTVSQIGLQLATSSAAGAAHNANASNSPSDLSLVTLWDGSTQVGSVSFTSDYATTSLSGFVVTANSQKLLTVKGDVSAVDVQLTKAIPGHLINVDFDAGWGDLADDDANEGAQGFDATGVSSGTKIYNGSAADSASNGARIVGAIPTITKIATSGKFTNTSDQVLYQFRIDAPAGTNGVGLYKFTFNISTNTSSVVELPGSGSVDPAFSGDFGITNLRVFCYSDSGFSQGSCGNSTGQLNQYGLLMADGAAATVDFDDAVTSGDPDTDAGFLFNPTASSGATAETIVVSPGTSRWFALKGNITGASSTPTIATKLLGDAAWTGVVCNADNAKLLVGNCDYAVGGDTTGEAYFTTRPDMIHATGSISADDGNVNDDFIWTDNATNTSQSVNSYNWMNGFLIPGLSNSGTAENLTL